MHTVYTLRNEKYQKPTKKMHTNSLSPTSIYIPNIYSIKINKNTKQMQEVYTYHEPNCAAYT